MHVAYNYSVTAVITAQKSRKYFHAEEVCNCKNMSRIVVNYLLKDEGNILSKNFMLLVSLPRPPILWPASNTCK